MEGWIKLHRKTLENPIVCKDGDHVAIWTFLLLSASHKEHQAIFAGEKITLRPGQLITGRKSISERFNITESKVQRVLKTFENERQIEQQTSNRNRIITILSWDEYQEVEQQDEQQLNNKRTTTEQQANTNKNVKNVKNEKNERSKRDITREPKLNYAEFVKLTETEHQKLLDEHGDESLAAMIDILNSYKATSGRTYKSDYHTMTGRGWVLTRYREEQPKPKMSKWEQKKNTLAELYQEAEEREREGDRDY